MNGVDGQSCTIAKAGGVHERAVVLTHVRCCRSAKDNAITIGSKRGYALHLRLCTTTAHDRNMPSGCMHASAASDHETAPLSTDADSILRAGLNSRT